MTHAVAQAASTMFTKKSVVNTLKSEKLPALVHVHWVVTLFEPITLTMGFDVCLSTTIERHKQRATEKKTFVVVRGQH